MNNASMGRFLLLATLYVVPVAAVVVSVLLLGEPVTWNLVVGGLVVLAGVGYAENRLTRRREHATIGR